MDALLPSSPNWYCSKVSDITKDGIFGFGAKGTVFLFQVSKDYELQYAREIVIGYSNKQRVQALKILNSDSILVGTVGGEVQLWNGKKMVDQHKTHKEQVMALDVNGICTISGDSKGTLCIWNRDTNKTSKNKLVSNDGVYCIKCCESQTAVGYRSGAVYIVHSELGTPIAQMRGHDEEVHSLSWITVHGDAILASSSRDRKIKIWNVGDGTLMKELEIPKAKGRLTDNQKDRLWLTAMWLPFRAENTFGIEQDVTMRIISGSYMGQMFLWEWKRSSSKTKGVNPIPFNAKLGHSRPIFNFCLISANNEADLKVISISMDRQVKITCVEKLNCLQTLACLGGYVYAATYSKLQPGFCAVGVGDNTIRVWNSLKESSHKSCDILWKGINSKVTSVQWHPTEMGTILYGTEAGHIGIYNSQSLENVQLRAHHNLSQVTTIGIRRGDFAAKFKDFTAAISDNVNSSIQEMLERKKKGISVLKMLNESFKKQPAAASNEYTTIWSLALDGSLLESSSLYPERSFRNISDKLKHIAPNDTARMTCISWLPKYTFVGLGYVNGTVAIVDHLAAWDQVQEKIQLNSEPTCIRFFLDDAETVLQMAAASATGMVVFKAYEFNASAGLVGDEIHSEARCIQIGARRVNDISWNSNGHEIAIAAGNKMVHVYNVASTEKISTFVNHKMNVRAVSWDNSSEGRLVSGGDDQCLRAWHIDDHSPFQESIVSIRSTGPTLVTPNARGSKKDTKKSPVGIGEIEISTFVVDTELHTNVDLSMQFNKMLSHHSTDDKHGTHQLPFILKLTSSDQESVHAAVQSEIKSQLEASRFESCAQILMVQGRIIDAMEMVIHHKILSPYWISVAPLAGHDIWMQAAYAYALQLQRKRQHIAAAQYFLAVDCIHLAILEYVAGNYFADAMILAKTRLPISDAIHMTVLEQWLEFLTTTQSCCIVAMLHFSGHNFDSALSVLSNCDNLECIRLGLALSRQINHPSTPLLVGRIVEHAVKVKNFEVAFQHIVENASSNDAYAPMLCLLTAMNAAINTKNSILESMDQLEITTKDNMLQRFLRLLVDAANTINNVSNAEMFTPFWTVYLSNAEKLYNERDINIFEMEATCNIESIQPFEHILPDTYLGLSTTGIVKLNFGIFELRQGYVISCVESWISVLHDMATAFTKNMETEHCIGAIQLSQIEFIMFPGGYHTDVLYRFLLEEKDVAATDVTISDAVLSCYHQFGKLQKLIFQTPTSSDSNAIIFEAQQLLHRQEKISVQSMDITKAQNELRLLLDRVYRKFQIVPSHSRQST